EPAKAPEAALPSTPPPAKSLPKTDSELTLPETDKNTPAAELQRLWEQWGVVALGGLAFLLAGVFCLVHTARRGTVPTETIASEPESADAALTPRPTRQRLAPRAQKTNSG